MQQKDNSVMEQVRCRCKTLKINGNRRSVGKTSESHCETQEKEG